MSINVLRITDFRNLAAVELSPETVGLNIITGDNGSGKTSFLEAIYYLGHGRSFRTANANQLINHHASKFSIFSQIVSDANALSLGVGRDTNGDAKQRIAEQNVSVAELANYLPIRIINSQSHQLFESGPAYRRKYLDWGLFYQFENFFSCWRNFERVLKQRNTLLRDNRVKLELNAWTEELVKYGLEFHTFRCRYIEELSPLLAQTVGELLDLNELEMRYLPGWDESKDYAQTLHENMPFDYACGYTQHGPHRADLDIRINGLPVKHFLSRGQQKLLICAMIIAQGILFFKHINKGLIYLVDDLPAELDLQSKTSLIALLAKQQMQIFITAIEKNMICAASERMEVPNSVFHVEQGILRTDG